MQRWALTANTDDSSWERKRGNEPSRVNRPFHFIAVRLRRRGSLIEGLLPGWSVSPLPGRAIHNVHFKAQPHNSTLNDPLLPSGITGLVAEVIGVDDLAALHAHARAGRLVARPAPRLGSNRRHLSFRRLRILQRLENIGRLGADDGHRRSECVDGSANTTFNTTWGLPQWPRRRAQVCTGPQGSH
jgi:hypothetical protein